MNDIDPARLDQLLDEAYPVGDDRRQVVTLIRILTSLPAPEHLPQLEGCERERARLEHAAHGDDGEALDEALLAYYERLHLNEAPYTAAERSAMDDSGGYWGHAGGLAPILRAAHWIEPDTFSCDLGAGNGLQGLLMQTLYPHRRCLQVELSSEMVTLGRGLQAWLGIDDERVEWMVGDVRAADLSEVDFIYLYRPLRPERRAGQEFYSRLAELVATSPRRPVVFSIADCLRRFIDPHRVEILSSDGHLTLLRRREG